jgi:Rrf2 family transcriptional regulator, cysteine metabolism repressor
MLLSRKDVYALRALFELGKRFGDGPAKVADIAEAQAIPAGFLEIILGECKQGGFVESRRGRDGGYLLVRQPGDLTVREVLEFLEGRIELADEGNEGYDGPRPGCAEVFDDLWRRVAEAIAQALEGVTFADLIEDEKRRAEAYVPSYAI